MTQINKELDTKRKKTSSILRVKAKEGTHFKLDWKEKVDSLNSISLKFDTEFSLSSIEIYEEDEDNEKVIDECKSDYWKIKLKEAIQIKQGDKHKNWFVVKTDVELFGTHLGDIQENKSPVLLQAIIDYTHDFTKVIYLFTRKRPKRKTLNNDQIIYVLLMFLLAIIIFIYLIT